MELDGLFKSLAAGARFSQADMRRERRRMQCKDGSRRQVEQTSTATESNSLPDELNFFKGSQDGPNPASTASSVSSGCVEPIKIPQKPIFPSEAAQRAFCKRKNIRVYGSEVVPPVRKFVDLCRPAFGMPLEVAQCVSQIGLGRMTPVQTQGIPVIVSGRDTFIVAPTGSGKTLVFVLSLLTQLMGKTDAGIRAIIISPTRELAAQTRDEFRRFTPRLPSTDDPALSSVLLNKSVLNNWQMTPAKRPPHVLISTPLRLVQAIQTRAVDLSQVRHIILDEGDRLLELGLLEQLDDILAACTFKEGPIQKVLLSATIPTGVEDLARSFMSDDPVKIIVGAPNSAAGSIRQRLLYVGQETGRLMAIRQLLAEGKLAPPVIIFTETIERATGLFHTLVEHGISVDVIHGGRTQAEREQIVAQFRAGRLWFLVTTDLLARGLDFPSVSCVINYDFPLTTASYIHRIGRTGRAGHRGKAITLFTREDVQLLSIVANVMRQSGCNVPEWMPQIKRPTNRAILCGRQRKRADRRDRASATIRE